MTYEPNAWDPTGRFSGLAEVYSRHRPSYPAPAIDFILAHCGLKPGSPVADVGCGTGISARQLAECGLRVIGIEPNADMRQEAQSVAGPSVEYRDGKAEATGLADASVQLVLAAQAFHWFQPEPTLREFQRILQPGGWVVLMWNERDESDPFTRAYGDLVRTCKDAKAVESHRPRTGDVLLHSDRFEAGQQVHFTHEQIVDAAGLLGRALSMSYAPRGAEEVARFAAALGQVFDRYQVDGQVVLRYQTSLTLGRKRVPS